MVRCLICNNEYRRITNAHTKKHSITTEEYLKRYPSALLICEESKVKYSEGAKRFYQELSSEQKKERFKNRKYSEEGRAKQLAILEYGRSLIKYEDPKRNQSIGLAKKEWWSKKTKKQKSDFIKEKIIPKVINNLGKEQYKAQLREKGIKGYQKLVELGNKKQTNSFESEMLEMVKKKGYNYVYQFEINKWFYDCYIPEKNLIIEFDGDYWHPKTLESCITEREKRQWYIDRKKEEIAKASGYKIVRIRESEKYLIDNII